MQVKRNRLLVAAALVVSATAVAHAQSSLGIGNNEATAPSAGLFPSFFAWINLHQQEFYRALTGALKSMRDDGTSLWLLVGLSFAYGVFHAAGPGHGKAVISSYMLANETTLRRGVVLSFVSAFLQGITAIVVVGAAYFVLRGAAISMTDTVWALEVASYALIAGFGLWLLVRKFSRMRRPELAAPVARHDHGHDHGHHHGHDHAHHHAHAHHDHDHAHHGEGEVCDECGHAHAPDPKLIGGDRLSLKTAAAAVWAVGIRPCSGALIVLSFALLNGLLLGGVLSVFAMALGTAITVSAMATLAVTAKNWAVRASSGGRAGALVHDGIEIAGAALVFVLGVVLLTASLSA